MKILFLLIGSLFLLTACWGDKTEKIVLPGADMISNTFTDTPVTTKTGVSTTNTTPYHKVP